MSDELLEAAFFYGDYSELTKLFNELIEENKENFDIE